MADKRNPRRLLEAASLRPTLVRREHALSTGHYLATCAGQRVLDRGGNAIDAGVTASMALAILQPDMVCFAGVAPTLSHLKKEGRVNRLLKAKHVFLSAGPPAGQRMDWT